MTFIRKIYRSKYRLPYLAMAIVLFVVPMLTVHKASAAQLSMTMVRFDQIEVSTATTGTVCITPATTSAGVKSWIVAIPSGYTVSATGSNWAGSVSTTTGWPTGATAWPNAASATPTVSGQNVTYTNSAAQTMNSGTIYCYNWTLTAAVTTSATPSASNIGSVTTQTSVPATIDTGTYAAPTVNTGNTISVTAAITQSFSFALSGTSDSLGTLTPGGVSVGATPRTVTIATNAKSGWLAWAKSAATNANGGLISPSQSYTIASTCSSGVGTNTTLAAGTEGYNTGITSTHGAGSGSGITIPSIFTGGSTGRGGGLCGSNFQTIGSDNGTAAADVLTLTNNAAISTITPPASDYADTITVTAAGEF